MEFAEVGVVEEDEDEEGDEGSQQDFLEEQNGAEEKGNEAWRGGCESVEINWVGPLT
jgi:hypothetical protein